MLTIPVVVHVVHGSNTPVGQDENLAYADIVDLIAGMNEDFRHASGLSFPNPYSGVDTEIEFCLAVRDTAGNAFDGVVRHSSDKYTELSGYAEGDSMKMEYHWNPYDYYNLYIVKNPTVAIAYATFATSHGSHSDGTVAVYTSTSGVLTHEFGHTMNLIHTFNINGSCINNDCLNDGDKVCDTPPKESANCGGSCTSPSNSCSTDEDDISSNNPYRPVSMGGLGDQVDLFENYMSYCLSCWGAFTIGQKERMRLAITELRISYLNSVACHPVVADDAAVAGVIPRDSCGVAVVGAEVTIANYGSNDLTSVEVELLIDSIPVDTISWSGLLDYGESSVIISPFISTTLGNHDLSAKILSANGQPDGLSANDDWEINTHVDFYCPLNVTNTPPNRWVDSLHINTILNDSGNDGGYGNYIGMSTDIGIGQVVNVSLKPGFYYNHNVHWYIWVDLNQDYDFEDSGEEVLCLVSDTTVDATITLPINAMLGETRMRVAISIVATTPTGTIASGEAEDYSINVVNLGCLINNDFPNFQGLENGMGNLIQDFADDMEWKRWSGMTPTGLSGPTEAYGGDYYIYLEANINYGNTGIFYTPCFDFSGLYTPYLSFYYHMWGNTMGALELLVSLDGGTTWSTPIWTKSGDQGNTWHLNEIDLSVYALEPSVQFQFRGTIGASYNSDIAIDNILVRNKCFNNLIIAETFELGDELFIQAADEINSTSLIEFGANITYGANEQVTLNNGFEVELGGIFEVQTEGCME